MRVNRQADVSGVATHLDCERRLGNQVAGVGADDTGADDLT